MLRHKVQRVDEQSEEGELTGSERVALVLGGGGLRGLAHVGAWRALQEAGVQVTEIVGTSIGALVGACIAGGMGEGQLLERAGALQRADIVRLNRWALLLNGIRQQSVFREDVFRAYLADTLPLSAFAQLRLPLSVNAADLGSGEQVWFGAGGDSSVPVGDAVYASCALPVFYPPAEIGGRYCVDGGVVDPLPISFALERGAKRVIAIDVGAGAAADGGSTAEKGMIAIHHRTMQIMGGWRRTAWEQRQGERYPDAEVLYVRPSLERYETFDFENTAFFLEEGYRATAEALRTASTP